jgi:antitoxin ParD1/3/4
MSGRNFSITEHLSRFVDRQVGSGRHQNASEVVREALRRYEDDILAEAASLAAIERVATEGIAAIERGDHILIAGPEDRRALLQRWIDGEATDRA